VYRGTTYHDKVVFITGIQSWNVWFKSIKFTKLAEYRRKIITIHNLEKILCYKILEKLNIHHNKKKTMVLKTTKHCWKISKRPKYTCFTMCNFCSTSQFLICLEFYERWYSFYWQKQINLTTMCIQKQYYFVTKYFILKFTSATVLRFQGIEWNLKLKTVLLNLETWN
jgi:hypothetical protein